MCEAIRKIRIVPRLRNHYLLENQEENVKTYSTCEPTTDCEAIELLRLTIAMRSHNMCENRNFDAKPKPM